MTPPHRTRPATARRTPRAPLVAAGVAGALALAGPGLTAPAAAAPLPRLGAALSLKLAELYGAPAPATAGLAVGPAGALPVGPAIGLPAGPPAAAPVALPAALSAAIYDDLVRWRRDVRDALHAATSRLAQLANGAGVRIPDVTVLTTEPVANTESSGFGWRNDPIRHRPRFHGGTDFRGKRGTPIAAAGAGVVTFAARLGGYGNVVFVDHGGGVVTRYAHLQRFGVRRGDAVAAGQTIGAMGSTGRTTGVHLHFEVRLDGAPVDPVLAMTVARIGRESPAAGRLAAFALAPELQQERTSASDPPRQRVVREPARGPGRARPAGTSRPDRPGRVKIAKPVS